MTKGQPSVARLRYMKIVDPSIRTSARIKSTCSSVSLSRRKRKCIDPISSMLMGGDLCSKTSVISATRLDNYSPLCIQTRISYCKELLVAWTQNLEGTSLSGLDQTSIFRCNTVLAESDTFWQLILYQKTGRKSYHFRELVFPKSFAPWQSRIDVIRLLSLWSNYQLCLSSGSFKGYHLQVNESVIQGSSRRGRAEITLDHVDSPILKINSQPSFCEWESTVITPKNQLCPEYIRKKAYKTESASRVSLPISWVWHLGRLIVIAYPVVYLQLHLVCQHGSIWPIL